MGMGVKTSPSRAMKMFAVAVSATLPSMSWTMALENPRDRASRSIRALLGYRQPAFTSTGMTSMVGRR